MAWAFPALPWWEWYWPWSRPWELTALPSSVLAVAQVGAVGFAFEQQLMWWSY